MFYTIICDLKPQVSSWKNAMGHMVEVVAMKILCLDISSNFVSYLIDFKITISMARNFIGIMNYPGQQQNGPLYPEPNKE